MGQKTNPSGFRLAWKKSWANPSFYEKFNYGKTINQDHNLVKFIKGFLIFFSITANIVLIRRVFDKIYVSIIFFNKNYMFRDYINLFKPKRFISVNNRRKKKNTRLSSMGFNYSTLRKPKYALVFNSFNLFESFNLTRLKGNKKRLKLINFIKYRYYKSLYLNSLVNLFYDNFKTGVQLKSIGFLNFNVLKLSLFKLKLMLIYCTEFYNVFIKLFIFRFFSQKLYFMLTHFISNFTSSDKVDNTDISFEKIKLLKDNLFSRNNLVVKKNEGLSLKRLVSLFVTKMTGIFNVNVSLIQLNNPSRNILRKFNLLKRSVRVRGSLKNKVHDIILVLYQSMLLKHPQMLNNFLASLIKYNVRSVRQIFSILATLFPYFCNVLNFKGIKMELKGRINGSKRSQSQKIQYGKVPLTVISSRLFYSYNKVMTIHGVYSLRIWYYIDNYENTKKN